MKNRIVQKLCSLLVSLVLMANIFSFTVKTPLKPKSVFEAPILQNIIAYIEWVMGGGGGTDPRPKPDGN